MVKLFKKTLNLLFVAFYLTMIICYILYATGNRTFNIVVEWNAPVWLGQIINFVLFAISTSFAYTICTSLYNKKIIIHIAICLVLNIVGYIVFEIYKIDFIYITGILPILHIMLILLTQKAKLRQWIIFAGYYIFLSIYQQMANIIKVNLLSFGNNSLNPLIAILYSIDMIILCACIFIYFNEKVGERIALVSVQHNIRPEDVGVRKVSAEEVNFLSSLNELPFKEKIKTIIKVMAYQIFQLIVVLIACSIGNRLIEGIIIFLSFFLFGLIIRNRWHANSLFVCTSMSAIMYYVFSKVTLPINISIFMPIVMGLIMTVGLCATSIKTQRYTEMKLALKPKPFKCKNATLDEFTKRCLEKGYTDERTTQAIDFLSCKRKMEKELAIQYYNDINKIASVKQWKRRAKNELES